MVPLWNKIEDCEACYNRLGKKNYSKGLATLYSGFVEEIIGDHAEAQDITQNLHKTISTGRDIDYLGDKSLILFVHASGPNQRLIQSAKGVEILGYSDQELQGAEFSEIIPRRF